MRIKFGLKRQKRKQQKIQKKRGGRRTIHKVRFKFRQKDKKMKRQKRQKGEERGGLSTRWKSNLDYQLILKLSLGDETITLKQGSR